MAVAQHTPTQRSKGQRSRSRGNENRHRRMVAKRKCAAGVGLHVIS